MDELKVLLIQNQTNLDRLRARARYLLAVTTSSRLDTHKLYGPYSDFWQDWQEQTDILLSEVKADIQTVASFCLNLKVFIQEKDQLSKGKTSSANTRATEKHIKRITKSACEALCCQTDMFIAIDLRIAEHKELANKLLQVEAIDSLNED